MSTASGRTSLASQSLMTLAPSAHAEKGSGRSAVTEPARSLLLPPSRGKIRCRKAASQYGETNFTSCRDGYATNAPAASADADAVVANAPHGRVRVVTLVGTRTNRNADPANATAPEKVCNNPVGSKAAKQNSLAAVLRAGPRAAQPRQLEPFSKRWPPARPLAAAGVRDNADFAHAAAPCPACWPDSADWHANAASAGLRGGNPHCSSAPGDGKAGTYVHSLSKDSGVLETDAMALDRRSTALDTEVGPREVVLPKVKPRRKVATLLRGVPIGTSTTPFNLPSWPPSTNRGQHLIWPPKW
jgi:hypothetical protein